MEELILSNENILLQHPLKTLKTGKGYELAVDLTIEVNIIYMHTKLYQRSLLWKNRSV
jgi:hypothetical protein